MIGIMLLAAATVQPAFASPESLARYVECIELMAITYEKSGESASDVAEAVTGTCLEELHAVVRFELEAVRSLPVAKLAREQVAKEIIEKDELDYQLSVMQKTKSLGREIAIRSVVRSRANRAVR